MSYGIKNKLNGRTNLHIKKHLDKDNGKEIEGFLGIIDIKGNTNILPFRKIITANILYAKIRTAHNLHAKRKDTTLDCLQKIKMLKIDKIYGRIMKSVLEKSSPPQTRYLMNSKLKMIQILN